MKILIAGAHSTLGKALLKADKKKHEYVTLDLNDDEVKQYAPVAAVFKAHTFDAVLYITAEGNPDAVTDAKRLILFKNLQYAAILNGVKKMIAVIDAGQGGAFDNLLTDLIEKDKIGFALRFYGLYGAGFGVKVNPIAKILADAKKKGAVTIVQDRAVSAVYLPDALNVLTAFLDGELPQGVYDVVPPSATTFADIAKSARKALKTLEITVKSPIGQTLDYTGDGALLLEVLPKLKFTSLHTGIAKTLE